MGEEKLFFVYVKALLLSVTFFMSLPIMAVSLCVSKDTVAEMNKKQPVYFVRPLQGFPAHHPGRAL